SPEASHTARVAGSHRTNGFGFSNTVELEWENVKNINLRKITKEKKKPTDPPAMGDSYFRY
ncbi:hypothetical protein BRM89_23705, partial [Xanthomonas oryzae pv. oryzae]